MVKEYDAVAEFDANWRNRPTYVTGDQVIVTFEPDIRYRGTVTGIGLPVTAARRFRPGDPDAGSRGYYQVLVPALGPKPMPWHESEMEPYPADEPTPTLTDDVEPERSV